MRSASQILDRIMRLRAAGKIIHLTPFSAGIVETASRSALADGNKLVGTLAFICDFEAAKAAWLQFTKAKPNDRLTWHHGTRVIQEQPLSDRFEKRA